MTTAAITRSSQIKWAVSGWAFFIAENAILSENRTWIIDQLGDDGYHTLYGAFSTAAMASVGFAYLKRLSRPPPSPAHLPALALSWGCLSSGLFLALQTAPSMQIPVSIQQKDGPTSNTPSWKLQVRCPFDFTHDRDNNETVKGIERISRHPGLWSLAFVALSNAALLPPLHPLQLWWMGPTAVAWVGGNHTDARYRRGMGGTLDPVYESQTSNIPFSAIVTGRQGNATDAMKKMLQEIKPLNALVSIGVATLFVLSRGRIKA
ncbi:hypothetical protein FisN_2Lu524 [Fistulifera solaris]|uniref:Uncharacterized protein n=1 Tax=Fistulifera solaris TaxID=1519565 RepID=A0A1Z5JAG8_FISSO|nr:hypothetical protein FisN_2Lu524 [Fistulifera solaris]|eukprot:GAX10994.1 hypothetical protein FisN_2Lu524 [Fistulifera solaris]